MKIKQLQEYFNQKDIDESIDLNPLFVAETREFNKKSFGDKHISYRQRALAYVTEHKLPFATTGNTVYEAFKLWVKVSCPYCGGETNVMHGGGTTNHTTITYRCNGCGAIISLGVPDDGLAAILEQT